MSKRKKKNRNLGPRRKRMRRPARLLAAVTWRARYGGKHLVKGYARWFGVDLLCAIVELRMLGVGISAEYEQQVRADIAGRARARATRDAARLAERTQAMLAAGGEAWEDDWEEAEAASLDEEPAWLDVEPPAWLDDAPPAWLEDESESSPDARPEGWSVDGPPGWPDVRPLELLPAGEDDTALEPAPF